MPLSEHEQKMLEQMERALYAEDPKFATQMQSSERAGGNHTRILVGIGVALLGLGLVVAGVSTQEVILGGIGFAVMVAGVAWAFTPGRTKSLIGVVDAEGRVQTLPATTKGKAAKGKGAARKGKAAARKGQKKSGSGTFMQRMEERWEQRRRQQGGL